MPLIAASQRRWRPASKPLPEPNGFKRLSKGSSSRVIASSRASSPCSSRVRLIPSLIRVKFNLILKKIVLISVNSC